MVSSSTSNSCSTSRAREADIPCEQGQTVIPVTSAPISSRVPSFVATALAMMVAVPCVASPLAGVSSRRTSYAVIRTSAVDVYSCFASSRSAASPHMSSTR